MSYLGPRQAGFMFELTMSPCSNTPLRERVGDRTTIFLRGNWWYVVYCFRGRQTRISLRTRSPRVARRRASEIEAMVFHSARLVPASKLALREAVRRYLEYLAGEGRRASTIKRYRGPLEAFVAFAEARGAKRLGDVEVELLVAYRRERLQVVSECTVLLESETVKQLLNHYVVLGTLRENPLCRLRLRKPKPKAQPVFTLAQVEQIATAASLGWGDLFRFLAATGLRISELAWLTWRDVDLEKGLIRIRAKDDWIPKCGDERAVPQSAKAKAILQSQHKCGAWVFTDPRGAKRQGQQISDRQALKELKRAMAKAGLEEGNLHALRRTFITQMSNCGVPVPMLASWVGHSDLNMILRYYQQDEAEGVRMMAAIDLASQNPTNEH